MTCKNYFIFVVIISRHFVFYLHSFLRVFILCAWADFACQSAYFFICFSRAYTRFAITKHCFVFCATVVAIVMLPLCAFQCSSMRTWGPAEAETTKPKKLTKNCLAMTNIFLCTNNFLQQNKKTTVSIIKFAQQLNYRRTTLLNLTYIFFAFLFALYFFSLPKRELWRKVKRFFTFLLFYYFVTVLKWALD